MTARPRKPASIALSVDTRRIAEEIASYLVELLGERLSGRQEEPSPLLLTVDRICVRTGLGQTFIKSEIRSGRLRARKAGDRVMVTPEDFASWVASLRSVVPAMGKSDGGSRSASVNGCTG